MSIQCPKCTIALSVPDSLRGQAVRCPRCRTPVSTALPEVVFQCSTAQCGELRRPLTQSGEPFQCPRCRAQYPRPPVRPCSCGHPLPMPSDVGQAVQCAGCRAVYMFADPEAVRNRVLTPVADPDRPAAPRTPRRRGGWAIGLVVALLLVGAGVGAAYLLVPGKLIPVPDKYDDPPATVATFIPADARVVVSVRPAALWKAPALEPIRETWDALPAELRAGQQLQGILVEDWVSLTAVLHDPLQGSVWGIVEWSKSFGAAKREHFRNLLAAQVRYETVEHPKLKGRTYLRCHQKAGDAQPLAAWSVTDDLLILGTEPGVQTAMTLLDRPRTEGKLAACRARIAQGADEAILGGAISVEDMAQLRREAFGLVAEGLQAPLPRETELRLRVTDRLRLDGTMAFEHVADAESLGQQLNQWAGLLQVLVKAAPPGMDAALLKLVQTLAETRVSHAGSEVKIALDVDLKPMLQQLASEASKYFNRFLTTQDGGDQLVRIGKAINDYHKQKGHYPPAVVRNAAGKPHHSWRVELLPFLGEAELYADFKKDEPLDSEANKKVLARMPAVYRLPQVANLQPDQTLFQILTGPATAFADPAAPPTVADPARTLLLTVLRRPVPWTAPEDVPIPATADELRASRILDGLGLIAGQETFPVLTFAGTLERLPRAAHHEFFKRLAPR